MSFTGKLGDIVKKPVILFFKRLPWIAQASVFACVATISTAIWDTPSVSRWTDVTKRVFRVALGGEKIPLSSKASAALARHKKNKSINLHAGLNQAKGTFAGQIWTSSQIIVAIRPTHPVDPARAENYFYSQLLTKTGGWRKHAQQYYPESIVVSSWVLRALAALSKPARDAQIDFMLDNQASKANRDDGWWPVYPLKEGYRDAEFASTYATALAVLALHEQLTLAKLKYKADEVRTAVRQGNNWLYSTLNWSSGRATDYPKERELVSVTALALHALHRTSDLDLSAFDSLWLKQLPPVPPNPVDFEASAKTIFEGEVPIQTDDVRYYLLPLILNSIIDAYPHGDLLGKSYALSWLERALVPRGPIEHVMTTKKSDWVAAEILIALQRL